MESSVSVRVGLPWCGEASWVGAERLEGGSLTCTMVSGVVEWGRVGRL